MGEPCPCQKAKPARQQTYTASPLVRRVYLVRGQFQAPTPRMQSLLRKSPPLPPLFFLILLLVPHVPTPASCSGASGDASINVTQGAVLKSDLLALGASLPEQFASPLDENCTAWTPYVRCGATGISWVALEGVGAAGELPGSWSTDLPSLRVVSLQNNAFNGSVPEVGVTGAARTKICFHAVEI